MKNKKIAKIKNGGYILDHATEQEHKQAAGEALAKAEGMLKSQKYDLIVCDEINNAIADNLIELDTVAKIVEGRGKTHLILTGRNAKSELIKLVDLVSEIKKKLSTLTIWELTR